MEEDRTSPWEDLGYVYSTRPSRTRKQSLDGSVPGMATDKQVVLLRRLCVKGFLVKSDFPDNRQYRRKRQLPAETASVLIALGIHRQQSYFASRYFDRIMGRG